MADRHNVLAAECLLHARRFAREFAHSWIGTEHLLLGLLEIESHPIRIRLLEAGANPRQLKDEVARMAPAVEQPPKAVLPLADSLKRLLEHAASLAEGQVLEAVHLEHLMLALLETRAGLGYALLVQQGVDFVDLERVLRAWLAERSGRKSSESSESNGQSAAG